MLSDWLQSSCNPWVLLHHGENFVVFKYYACTLGQYCVGMGRRHYN